MQPAQRPQETHRYQRRGDSRIRLARLWVLAACLGAALFACTDNRSLTGPHAGGAARLGFAPRYTYLGGSYFGEPINRIRLTARDLATDAVVGTLVTDVDPNQQNWELALDVDLAGPIQVVVTIELLNVNLTTGAESIQWSGQTAPIDVAPSRPAQTATPIQLFQGPPSNLGVTAVVITPATTEIEEGTSANLTAAVTGPQGAQAVWSSADPLVATVDQNGRVTALRDGVASIYAVAGPKADTATIRVRQAVASVALTPDTRQLTSIGQEAAFTARVLDRRGNEIVGAQVVWSVADSSIARHLGDGRYVARANGTTALTAASATQPDIKANGTLVVQQRVARLSITPDPVTLNAIGATRAFTAVAHDGNGNGMLGQLVWRSSNTAVATIDATGNATATGAGTAEISAVAGTGADTVVARATLHVSPEAAHIDIAPEHTSFNSIGDTLTLRAVVTDANGNVIPGARPEWSNRVAGVVVIEGDGLVRAIGNGQAEIAARIGRISGNATVVVQQTTALISILPALDTVAVSDTRQFAAQARDARGNPFAGALLNWQSSDSSVATVDATGLVRGLRAGTVTISARANGVFANATLVVRNRPPASVVIAPDGARINAIGYTAQLLATVFDDLGHALPDVAVTWSSLEPHVATVSAGGLVTAVANGTARVVASVNPADTVVITVQQVPAVLRVQPVEAVLNAGDSVAVSASAADSNGVAIAAPAVTYESSNPDVATVDNAGVVRARRHGNATITAALGALRATVGIVVHAADLRVGTVTTIPADAFDDGGTAAFTIRVHNDGDAPAPPSKLNLELLDAGTHALIVDSLVTLPSIAAGDSALIVLTMPLLTSVPWPTSIEARVSVDALDQLAEISEANNQATTPAHAVRFPVATLVATPDALPFDAPGHQSPITVVLRDRLGRVLTGRPVTFTSSDSTIARVNDAGVVTARRTGTARIVVASGAAADTVVVTVAPPNLTISQWGAQLSGAFADADSVRVRGWIRNPTPAPSGAFRYRVRLLNAANNAQIGTDIATDVAQLAGGDSIQVDVAFDGDVITWPDSVLFELQVDSESAVEESSEADNLARTAVQHVTYGVASLALGADSIALNITATHQFSARLLDRLGRDLRRPVTWQSSAPLKATVDGNGLVTAIAAGSAWIYAQSEGVRDSVHVTVNAANLVLSPLTVTPATPIEGQTLTISSKVRNTGTVGAAAFNATVRIRNAANGAVLQALNVGIFPLAAGDSVPLVVPFTIDTVTAWPDALKAEVQLDSASIIPESNEADNSALSGPHPIRFRVASIFVAPRRLDLNTTVDTGSITVVSKDRYARVLSDRTVNFLSRNPGLADVNANGLVTGHGSGTTWVLVTVEGRTDSVEVVVVGEPNRLLIHRGDNQTGIVDRNLADSLEVEVLDASNQPVANAEVTWTTDGGSVPASSRTNAAGIASARWQLGRVAGARRVTVCVAALPCVEIHGRANPDRPNRGRRKTESEDQLVTVAQVAPNALELTVVDQFDNPTEGALVEWSVALHHGSLSANSTLTDSLGVARVTWTMPTNKGTLLVQYVVKDNAVVVDSGSFRAHARPDRPHGGRKQKGDDQYVTVGTVAGDSLILEVTDQYGNGVPAALVNWTVNGGATLDASATHTDSAGLTMVRLLLGTARGQRSVRADVMDGASVVASETFRITGKPDKPTKQNKGLHADSQSVVVNQIAANALELIITDQYDNPVDSANVHWSLRAGHVDGSLSSPVTTTDSAGRTTVSWNVGKRAGNVFVDYVIFDADNVTQLISGSFHASAQPGARARVRVPRDSIGSDALGDTTDVTAGTEDEFGNARVGDPITWTSSDSTLVKILPNGRMITRRNGRTTIVATSGPFSTPVIVGVRQRIRYLELSADTLTALQINHRLRRIQKDRLGNQIDSIYHEPLVWSSSDTTVAKVGAATGIVTSVGVGTAVITAFAQSDNAVISSVTVIVRTVRGNRVAPVVPTISEATRPADSKHLREPALPAIVKSANHQSGRPIRG